ncbi:MULTISPECIES: pyroglutamyl-peptidase I [Pseudomonas]|uniref:pyroglutamyl-peptidase I n=1 Tax=Pseudomonas TaxID=286 RepID=UPI0003048473|nr:MULTISPECIES: pyroglutamyl-peptidase I [Pseudomonas]MDC7829773.1 pyroglutamyl-peptidase I [Pseudomonas benzopyrenica]MXS20262.1 pyroglutamyl-peptidase I [Pseudomonas oryzihabitans]
MTLLLTGFAPFGGEELNPSWEAVRRLDGERLGDLPVVAAQLPTAFGAALRVLDELLDRHRPTLVVAVGQAGGRAELSLERIAINVDDARIPDNAGRQPIDEPVVAGGPAAYFSTLPIKAMVHALRAAGFPAAVSQTAGTFVCNHVFYGLQHRLQGTGVRGGFIHIPYLPAQAANQPGAPSMALETLVAGLRLALTCAATTQADLREGGGQLD